MGSVRVLRVNLMWLPPPPYHVDGSLRPANFHVAPKDSARWLVSTLSLPAHFHPKPSGSFGNRKGQKRGMPVLGCGEWCSESHGIDVVISAMNSAREFVLGEQKRQKWKGRRYHESQRQ